MTDWIKELEDYAKANYIHADVDQEVHCADDALLINMHRENFTVCALLEVNGLHLNSGDHDKNSKATTAREVFDWIQELEPIQENVHPWWKREGAFS